MRREVRLPRFPECWESCGACSQGDVTVLALCVAAGDRVRPDDVLLTLETGKTALDIQSPYGGVVQEIRVAAGDRVTEGILLLTLEDEHAN